MRRRSFDNLTNRRSCGFTLVEVLAVVVILGLAAVIAVPLISDSGDVQIASAGRQIVSTLLFVQTAAITHQQRYRIVFDTATESYSVIDEAGNPVTDNILDNTTLQVDFPSTANFSKVDIDTVDFDGTDRVWFDRLGAPYSGDIGAMTPMTSGSIVLSSGQHAVTVSVEPVTGRITLTE